MSDSTQNSTSGQSEPSVGLFDVISRFQDNVNIAQQKIDELEKDSSENPLNALTNAAIIQGLAKEIKNTKALQSRFITGLIGRTSLESRTELATSTYKWPPVIKDSADASWPPESTPPRQLCGDHANAHRFVIHQGMNMAFDNIHGWLNYCNGVWITLGKDDALLGKALTIYDTMEEELLRIDDVTASHGAKLLAKDTLLKAKLHLQNNNGALAMVKAARAPLSVAVNDYEWENPHLINVLNGAVDIRTGERLNHKRDHFFTAQCNVSYDPTADAPLWKKFIADITSFDKDLATFLQVALGYGITGYTNLEKIFAFYGSGDNGKSVLMAIIALILAAYQTTADSSLLIKSHNKNMAVLLGTLMGKRFVAFNELPAHSQLDVDAMKYISSATDEVQVRKFFKDSHPYHLQCTCYIRTNNKPRISENTDGVWKRFRTVPFTFHATGDKKDVRLFEKLKKELPGIFNWLVDGARMYYELQALPPCKAVDDETRDYKIECDPLGQWVQDCLDFDVPDGHEDAGVYTKDLYTSYRDYMKDNFESEITLDKGWFARRLKERISKEELNLKFNERMNSHKDSYFLGAILVELDGK
jgi:putative DNA primase/helicase